MGWFPIFTKKLSSAPETNFGPATSNGMRPLQTTAMPKITDPIEPIDRKTVRSICDAVGERLQQSLRPDFSGLTPYLRDLLEELRKRDNESRAGR